MEYGSSLLLEQMEKEPIMALLMTWHEGWGDLGWIERYAIVKGLTQGQFAAEKNERLATQDELAVV